MKNIQLILLTTEGCAGCDIMHKLLTSSIANIFQIHNINNIGLEVVDHTKRKDLCEKHNITDFPTTLIFVDSNYKTKIIGTNTVSNIVNTIINNID